MQESILITGAGKGIGKEIAINFLKKNYFVYAIIRNKNDNKNFLKFSNIKIINSDVSNFKILSKIFLHSKKNNKKILGLINNAGIRFRKNFLKITHKDLKKVFETNFFSIFKIMQEYTKYIKKNNFKGNIVNIASIVGQLGFSELSAYASSKAALISLTKSFVSEMKDSGIRANTISPGFTKTSYFKKFKKKKKLYNWTLKRTPLNRWGEAREIANLVYFLISNQSEFINGENINIDGGWMSS